MYICIIYIYIYIYMYIYVFNVHHTNRLTQIFRRIPYGPGNPTP